jgi:hypothetical protein
MTEETKTDEQQPPQGTSLVFKRHENFENWYANNVQYFPTEWDLKLVFGQVDWEQGKMLVEQHTGMTVDWLQAKMMLYFLTLQVGVYEMQYGELQVPASVVPPEPLPPSTEDLKSYPAGNRVFEFIKKIREQMFGSGG